MRIIVSIAISTLHYLWSDFAIIGNLYCFLTCPAFRCLIHPRLSYSLIPRHLVVTTHRDLFTLRLQRTSNSPYSLRRSSSQCNSNHRAISSSGNNLPKMAQNAMSLIRDKTIDIFKDLLNRCNSQRNIVESTIQYCFASDAARYNIFA